jgi:inositol phosphorylceramide synthase regulatory subunit
MIYSYAIHLRKGSYRTLPRSRPQGSPFAGASTLPDDEEDVEDFYLLPVRGPPPGSAHGHTPSGSSITSFADFVSAPGRARRNGRGARKASALNPASSKSTVDGADDVDEVLFDEDELAAGMHTKASTDAETASASGSGGRESPDEQDMLMAGEPRTPGSSTRRTNRSKQ